MTEIYGSDNGFGLTDSFLRELQIVENKEDDGFSQHFIDRVLDDSSIFEQRPGDALRIYETCSLSKDPAMRLRAFVRLPDLAAIDSRTAFEIYSRLLVDKEVADLLQANTAEASV